MDHPYRHGTIAGLIERCRRVPSLSLTRRLAEALIATGPVAWRGCRWEATEGQAGLDVVVDCTPGSTRGIPIADTVAVPGPM